MAYKDNHNSTTPYTPLPTPNLVTHCTECGTSVARGDNFCRECGSNLRPMRSEAVRNACTCGAVFIHTEKHCRACGKSRPAS